MAQPVLLAPRPGCWPHRLSPAIPAPSAQEASYLGLAEELQPRLARSNEALQWEGVFPQALDSVARKCSEFLENPPGSTRMA